MTKAVFLPVVFVSSVGISQAAGWFDTFDTINPSWVTDRKEPSGFASEVFLGDARLKITVNGSDQSSMGSFYYTEGRQRSALLGTPWSVVGEVYIDLDGWTDKLVRTDLWARTGLVGDESTAQYPILGVIYNDPNDPWNSSSSNKVARFRVWDPGAGGWQTLSTPVTSGWQKLRIEGDGTSFRHFINDVLVYHDTTIGSPTQLTTVFLQAFNFGGDNNYSVYWDNVGAQAVPEPLTLGLAAAGLAVAVRKRRR